jgi:hypothetical protein
MGSLARRRWGCSPRIWRRSSRPRRSRPPRRLAMGSIARRRWDRSPHICRESRSPTAAKALEGLDDLGLGYGVHSWARRGRAPCATPPPGRGTLIRVGGGQAHTRSPVLHIQLRAETSRQSPAPDPTRRGSGPGQRRWAAANRRSACTRPSTGFAFGSMWRKKACRSSKRVGPAIASMFPRWRLLFEMRNEPISRWRRSALEIFYVRVKMASAQRDELLRLKRAFVSSQGLIGDSQMIT